MRRVVVVALAWACTPTGSGHTVPPTDGPRETGSADTGGHTGPVPAIEALTCSPTDNALRVECEIGLSAPAPVEVRWARADGSGLQQSRTLDRASASHRTKLTFLAPDAAYAVEASVDGFASSTGATFTTGHPPGRIAARLEVEGAADTPLVGTNLPCDLASAEAGIFDTTTGELVWYELMDRSGSFGGFEMVQFTEDHTVLGLTGDHVVEVDLGGRTLLRRPYDLDYHHDLFRRNGKTWLLFSEAVRSDLRLDGFVVWDAAGVEVSRWREADALAVPPDARGDWSHASSIWVAPDESVVLSMEARDTVLGVAPAGEVAWAIGRGAPDGLVVDWSGVDGADDFSEPHAVSRQPDGALQLLDNHHGRALRLALDEGAGTAAAVAAFPAGASRCGPQGTAATSAAGGVFAACAGPRVQEWSASGQTVLWSATLACDSGEGGGGGRGQVASRWYPLDGWAWESLSGGRLGQDGTTTGTSGPRH